MSAPTDSNEDYLFVRPGGSTASQSKTLRSLRCFEGYTHSLSVAGLKPKPAILNLVEFASDNVNFEFHFTLEDGKPWRAKVDWKRPDDSGVFLDPETHLDAAEVLALNRATFPPLSPVVWERADPGYRIFYEKHMQDRTRGEYDWAKVAESPPRDIDFEDLNVDFEGLKFGVRIYRSSGKRSAQTPVVLWIQGGAWRTCKKGGDASFCGQIVEDKSPTTRFGTTPDKVFPTQYDEAHAFVRWASSEAAEFGVDIDRQLWMGASSGGCLIASQMMSNVMVKPQKTLLVVPLLDNADEAPWNVDCIPTLTKENLDFFRRQYLPESVDRKFFKVSPLRAPNERLKGCPPCSIYAAELDPLLPQAEMFTERLRANGIAVEIHVYPGMPHEMIRCDKVSDPGSQARKDMIEEIKRTFCID